MDWPALNLESTSIVVCALAVAGLLVAERRESAAGVWLTKPMASLAFIGVAVACGALDTVYGRLIGLGLLLCLLGDVLLIPADRPQVFRFGVFAFLCGHVAFAAAFLTQPLDPRWLVIAAILLAAALWRVWRWLSPFLPADMRRPVQAYFAVIATMTALACAVTGAGGTALVALGALAFTASDVSVARDRFVRPEFVNRAWGLPLYYLAQVLLAMSPAWVLRTGPGS
jgi:uncharacterized membrane protein YhhN